MPRKSVPLEVRPGARFTCFGDGLCCTDIHGLGPLTRREVRSLELISDDVVLDEDHVDNDFDDPMLCTRGDGGCVFLGEGRCDLHAALGVEAKPDGCRRFPFGLSMTPGRGRVTTRHRCPCRTLGDRPPLTARAAEPALRDYRGRLDHDRRVGSEVRLTARRRASFAHYEALEKDLLTRMAAGEDPARVLDVEPFPDLGRTTWKKEAHEMLDAADQLRFGSALASFARGVLAGIGKRPGRIPDLPWSDAFDRAEARSPSAASGDDIVADWVADEIWSLAWTDDDGTLARGRRDLATRLAVCGFLRRELERRGRRSDRAAAEAVTIVDMIGDSEYWSDLVATMPR